MRRCALTRSLTGLMLLVSCSGERALPTDPRPPNNSALPVAGRAGPSFAISDGAHQGNPHFYFLPPIAPAPTVSGTFDGTLAPVVDICPFVGGTCTGSSVAHFTIGAGATGIRVDLADQLYLVVWQGAGDVQAGTTYRIRVSIQSQVLGYADALRPTAGQLVPAGTVNLKDGQALPIKFRIEQGALALPLVTRPIASGITVYTNPLDATLAVVPGGPNGQYVRFFGTKDAAGLPATVLGYRIYALNTPDVYDEAQFGPDGRPTSVALRDGSTLQFVYRAGNVTLQMRLADGTEGSTTFPFSSASIPTLRAGGLSANATANVRPSAMSTVAAATAATPTTLSVFFNVTHVTDGSPVTAASVDGLWLLLTGGDGFFTAVPTPTLGQYATTLPLTDGILETAAQACPAFADAVKTVCDFLGAADDATGIKFFDFASSKCGALAPGLQPACLLAVAVAKVGCGVGKACDLFQAALDASIKFDLSTGSLSLLVNVLEKGCPYRTNVQFGPPVDPANLTATVQTPCAYHLTMSPHTAQVPSDGTSPATLTTTVTDVSGVTVNSPAVTWTYLDLPIVSVTPSGASATVTGLAAGTTRIEASFQPPDLGSKAVRDTAVITVIDAGGPPPPIGYCPGDRGGGC